MYARLLNSIEGGLHPLTEDAASSIKRHDPSVWNVRFLTAAKLQPSIWQVGDPEVAHRKGPHGIVYLLCHIRSEYRTYMVAYWKDPIISRHSRILCPRESQQVSSGQAIDSISITTVPGYDVPLACPHKQAAKKIMPLSCCEFVSPSLLTSQAIQ